MVLENLRFPQNLDEKWVNRWQSKAIALMLLFFDYQITEPRDEPRMQKSIPDNAFLIVKN